MSYKLILITGANRGIGFATLQALSLKTPSDRFLLGCRDKHKGEQALAQLRNLGVESQIDILQIDVASDDSLVAAAKEVYDKYGKLDVLINNAGVGLIHESFSDMRTAYNRTFDVNVTSVAVAMDVFLPLLRASPHGQVINVSSARGSLGLSSSGQLPPTVAMAYCTSKAALNMLTVEYGKTNENRSVTFQTVSPGHCKTAFNNYRGRKEPAEGAKVIVVLVSGRFGAGFWQMEEGDETPIRVPW